MSKEEAIRVRISADMRQQLDRIAELRGESVSVVIRDALREYLALGAPDPGPAAKATALRDVNATSSSALAIATAAARQILAQSASPNAEAAGTAPDAAAGSLRQPSGARRRRTSNRT
jgi:hypothetical protein